MSEYSSSSVTIEVTPTNEQQLAALLSQTLGESSTWVASCELNRVRQSLAAANDARQLQDLLGSVALTLPTIAGSSTSAARSTLALTGTLPTQLRRELDSGLAVAERQVLQVERVGVSSLAVQALRRIGYTVRHADNGSRTAIEARRGHSVLLVEVADGGAMQMDWLGHRGDDCDAGMAEVREELAADGLKVEIRRRDRHGSPDGGSLITRAAEAGNGDLVAGLLADTSRLRASTTTIQTQRRARLTTEG